MMIRAVEAHRLAIENEAITKLVEQSLFKTISSTRLFRSSSKSHQNNNRSSNEINDSTSENNESFSSVDSTTQTMKWIQSTVRLWIPVGITCFFWLSLLPPSIDDYINLTYYTSTNDLQVTATTLYTNASCRIDSAYTTIWITQFITSSTTNIQLLQQHLSTKLWSSVIMPYHFLFQPKRFWKHTRQILRVIRLLRFATPFARMLLKLYDQINALKKTKQQSSKIEEEKEKRLESPSLLLKDLKKIESLAKVQTALASLAVSNLRIYQSTLVNTL